MYRKTKGWKTIPGKSKFAVRNKDWCWALEISILCVWARLCVFYFPWHWEVWSLACMSQPRARHLSHHRPLGPRDLAGIWATLHPDICWCRGAWPSPVQLSLYLCCLRPVQKDARRKNMKLGGINTSRPLMATRLVSKTMNGQKPPNASIWSHTPVLLSAQAMQPVC